MPTDVQFVQDAYATGPELGLPTTVGSFALKESKTRGNAAVIDAVRYTNELAKYKFLLTCSQLLAAGMILIGKSNLSVST